MLCNFASPCHFVDSCCFIFSVLKSGGAAPFIEALPLVFGLDAAAATTGDHPDHAIEDGDEEQGRDEAQHQNVHSGHSAGVHGCYEASILLQLV